MRRRVIAFVHGVDRVNRTIGRAAMYLVLVMGAILLYSSVSKAFHLPANWTLEMAQFTMTAYYMLGGAYSMQLDGHVRMDLLYSRWSPRRRALADAITSLFLLSYLVMMLVGGFSSTQYALEYGEESYSSWAPYMAPIKIVMCIGLLLFLLQAIATFCRNVAEARGRPLP